MKLIEIENKIKYDESIIRHLFITVKKHSGEDSQLLVDSKNIKAEDEEIHNKKVAEEPEVTKPIYNTESEEVDSKEDFKEKAELEEVKSEEDKDE